MLLPLLSFWFWYISGNHFRYGECGIQHPIGLRQIVVSEVTARSGIGQEPERLNIECVDCCARGNHAEHAGHLEGLKGTFPRMFCNAFIDVVENAAFAAAEFYQPLGLLDGAEALQISRIPVEPADMVVIDGADDARRGADQFGIVRTAR